MSITVQHDLDLCLCLSQFCVCVCVCTCTCVHVEARSQPQILFLRSQPPCFWKSLPLRTWGSHNQDTQQAPKISSHPFPWPWIKSVHYLNQLFARLVDIQLTSSCVLPQARITQVLRLGFDGVPTLGSDATFRAVQE